jgi:uncharacterized protein
MFSSLSAVNYFCARMKMNRTNTKTELLQKLLESSSSLGEYGVSRLGIFGSFVRNEQVEKSNVDFLVEFEKDKKTYKNFIRLAYFLEELIGRRIELLTPESLSPYMRPNILAEVEYVQFGS